MQIYTPVLLTISRNLNNAWRVFEVVKSVRPPQLYIAVNLDSKDERTQNFKSEIDRMSREIDWQCELKTSFAKNSVN